VKLAVAGAVPVGLRYVLRTRPDSRLNSLGDWRRSLIWSCGDIAVDTQTISPPPRPPTQYAYVRISAKEWDRGLSENGH
jgi:hypothetical protein